VRLWIDTDIGDNPDDAVALLCAAAHPDVELVGVSTTGGRTEWRAELARELVAVDVVAGEHPDALAQRLGAAKPDAVLAIGPLTNIAALTLLGVPLLPLTVMGGLLVPLRHRGRLRRVERNFSQDPSAAAMVLAGIGITVVPLDVTVAMRLEPAVLDQLVAAAPKLQPEIERWIAEQDEPVVLHDPLALLVALGESFVTIESRVLWADATDGTMREGEGGHEHAVVVSVDAPAAVDRVLGLLG
jgi:pyrimidine-specific ribonucleoside hydrolase